MPKLKETATLRSLHLQGIGCAPVEIEVDVAPGLPQFIIVGLPDAAVSEARDRVRSAIRNSGYLFPLQRVTVNLAPANLRKAGSLYDLPIALGILAASRQISAVPDGFVCGELALDGRLRPVRGALPLVHFATAVEGAPILLPAENGAELARFPNSQLRLADSLVQVVAWLQDKSELAAMPSQAGVSFAADPAVSNQSKPAVDFSEIIGHASAKRACEIAAAGRHNLFLAGPPGVGKTLLAKALPGIMPPLTEAEQFEVETIRSVAGESTRPASLQPPFRAPHHSASAVAMIGGGSQLLPGEMSLAHRGVLFLDEAPEFRRDVLEALRQPLEDGQITVRRAHGTVEYPARCLLVLAQNPCPCGFAGSERPGQPRCSCSPLRIRQYAGKLSGPLLDRIDIKIFLPATPTKDLTQVTRSAGAMGTGSRESSSQIRPRVLAARERQVARQGAANGELSAAALRTVALITPEMQRLLELAMRRHGLSLRGYIKALRLARTIADLDATNTLAISHLTEALAYVLPTPTGSTGQNY